LIQGKDFQDARAGIHRRVGGVAAWPLGLPSGILSQVPASSAAAEQPLLMDGHVHITNRLFYFNRTNTPALQNFTGYDQLAAELSQLEWE
jgi:hypothetical protein